VAVTTPCTTTSPKPEDMHLLATTGKVRANAYDMVLNGNEMRIDRIHDKATQQLMFKYLGFTEETG
jgi:aspartyl-tRNA synthetase